MTANKIEHIQHAEITCKKCGYNRIINCSPDFETEQIFYLMFKPSCRCGSNEWEIKKVIEVVKPLSDDEKNLFAMGGQ